MKTTIDNTDLKTVFEKAKNLIVFDVYNQYEYEDSLTVKGFDFVLFKPCGEEIIENNESFCKLYFDKQSELVRVDFYSNLKGENFTFLFFHTEEFVFYNAYCFNTREHIIGDGHFVKGFFIFDKRLKINTFFALKSEVFIHSYLPDENKEKVDLGGTLLKIKAKVGTDDVYKTFMLDKKLNALSRINWINNEFLTYSDIKYNGTQVSEEVIVYSKKTCEFNTNLDEIKLVDFYMLQDDRGCGEGISLFAHPFYDEESHLPVWAYPERRYRKLGD